MCTQVDTWYTNEHNGYLICRFVSFNFVLLQTDVQWGGRAGCYWAVWGARAGCYWANYQHFGGHVIWPPSLLDKPHINHFQPQLSCPWYTGHVLIILDTYSKKEWIGNTMCSLNHPPPVEGSLLRRVQVRWDRAQISSLLYSWRYLACPKPLQGYTHIMYGYIMSENKMSGMEKNPATKCTGRKTSGYKTPGHKMSGRVKGYKTSGRPGRGGG